MLNHRIRGEIPRTSGTYREITQPVSQHGLRAAAGAAALGSWWLSIMSVCLFNYSIICRNVNMSSFLQAQSSASSCCVGTLERMQKEFYSSTSTAFATIATIKLSRSWRKLNRSDLCQRPSLGFVSIEPLQPSKRMENDGGPWHEASLSICIIECITKYYKILQTYA